MKHLVFLIVLLNCIGMQAQDWAPILAGEKYHFGIDGSDLISHTIHVDSTESIGNDDILHLNRVLTHCDTCSAEMYGFNDWACPGDSCLMWDNGAQFLKRQITIQEDGLWVFSDPGYFVLIPGATLGSSWSFDGTLEATVSILFLGEVLGASDSLKQIDVSDGSSFLLSKNHGLVSCSNAVEDFDLKGLQNQEVGETLPDFLDIFDFEVGDVLEHRFYRFIEAYVTEERGILQKEVVSVQNYSDSVVVEFQVSEQTNWEVVYPYPNTDSGIIYYSGLEESTFRKSGRKYIQPVKQYIDSVDQDIYFNSNNLGLDSVAAIFEHGFAYDRKVITSGLEWNMSPNLDSLDSGILLGGTVDNNLVAVANSLYPWESLALSLGNYNRHGTMTFAEGLGRVCAHNGDLSWSPDFEWMTGFVKGGDTTGVVTASSVILSNLEFEQIEVSISPNPTQGISLLRVPSPNTYLLRIVDIQGRFVLQEGRTFGRSPFAIDLSKEPAGIYLIQLSNEKHVWSGRVVKE